MTALLNSDQRQLLIMLSLAAGLSVVGQILIKVALNHVDDAASLSTVELLAKLGGSVYVYLGLVLYGVAMIVFFKLLAQASLLLVGFSLALGYVLLILLAWLILGETLTGLQLIGAALIVIGVLVINAK